MSALELKRQYVKLCDVRDFDDPALRKRIHSILPEHDRTEIQRKHWEFAILTLFLVDVGKLDERAQVLYWLANRVRRIVATDIYGEGEFGTREAEASMLTDPAAFAPYPYPEERL